MRCRLVIWTIMVIHVPRASHKQLSFRPSLPETLFLLFLVATKRTTLVEALKALAEALNLRNEEMNEQRSKQSKQTWYHMYLVWAINCKFF